MTTMAAERAGTGRLLRAGVFHYGRLVLNGSRAFREVAQALAATPDERVLDIGCGCGGFCRAVPGPYLGIDLDPDYIAFARWRFGRPGRRFEVRRLEHLPESDRFDKAILASALHHCPDDVVRALLARLARIVTKRLVVLELDPERANRLQRVLLDNDRGEYIRPVATHRTLLEQHFAIAAVERFTTTTGSAPQVVFTCEPRAGTG